MNTRSLPYRSYKTSSKLYKLTIQVSRKYLGFSAGRCCACFYSLEAKGLFIHL